MPGRYQFSLPERPSRDGWFRIGTLDVTTTALLVGLGIVSMFWYAADKVSLFKLAFVAPFVRDGEVWRVVSWPVVNPPNSFWVLLTLAFFWFVGHRIEDQVGRKRFTTMIVLMTVLPAAAVSLFDLTAITGQAYGLRVLAIALLVVFAFDSPNATWFLGIPLWIVSLAFVALDALQLIGDRWWGTLLVELGAVIVGAVTARQYGMLSDLAFIPQFGGGRNRGRGGKPARRKRSSGGSSVVAGPWQGSAPASAGLTPLEHAELDSLLDKTSAQGLDSLSKTEKARLNELSKKLRSSR